MKGELKDIKKEHQVLRKELNRLKHAFNINNPEEYTNRILEIEDSLKVLEKKFTEVRENSKRFK